MPEQKGVETHLRPLPGGVQFSIRGERVIPGTSSEPMMENLAVYEGAVYAVDIALERARQGDLDGVEDPTRTATDRVEDAPFPTLVERIERSATETLRAVGSREGAQSRVVEHLAAMRDDVEELGVRAREEALVRPWGTSGDSE
jgi:hypothetical protein